jgi:two-component sensor histidine kinase
MINTPPSWQLANQSCRHRPARESWSQSTISHQSASIPYRTRVETMSKPISQGSFPGNSLLIREFAHRINNEFTSAINLVTLEAVRSRNSEVKAALHDVGQRLQQYAQVHRLLQMPEHDSRIDAALYLRQLCLSISQSKLEYNDIDLIAAVRPVSMQSDRSWLLGMIVYELITNAARHAFNGAEREILVELWAEAACVECRVSDNGRAPETIKPGRGLSIVQELAKRLDGKFVQSFGPQGSTSLLIFPA